MPYQDYLKLRRRNILKKLEMMTITLQLIACLPVKYRVCYKLSLKLSVNYCILYCCTYTTNRNIKDIKYHNLLKQYILQNIYCMFNVYLRYIFCPFSEFSVGCININYNRNMFFSISNSTIII